MYDTDFCFNIHPEFVRNPISPESNCNPSIARFIGSAVDVAVEVQKQSGPKIADFRKVLAENPPGMAGRCGRDVHVLRKTSGWQQVKMEQ